ncbi:MAG TPA: hypothetical protein VL995_11115 [Cellvibrio sp.]|nr:hypothetical protein [Cellvibrio sp.]
MSADMQLIWEWPADRTVEQNLLIKVIDVEKENTGIFGFEKTPSFVGNLPDPVTVTAKVISQEADLKEKTIKIFLPKLELKSIKKDDFAVIGIVDNKVCICIRHVESENMDVSGVSCP